MKKASIVASEVASNTVERLDVIAVGAHPDDVEIACGGTLARLVRQGYRVGIIDLTDGEPTPRSPGPEVRLEEARRAAEVLGVQLRLNLGMPNRRLFDSFEARVALATEFRRYRPRVVLGFGDKTPMNSPDHWQAMQITDAAVFYSRLTKWDEYFAGLPVHTISAQLYYSLAFGSPEGMSHGSNLVVDIGETLETKLESVRCYETQFPPEKAHIHERIRAVALTLGFAAGYTAGELFNATRMLGTRDLMHFLLGERPADAPRRDDPR
ncbi:MAG: PIG-L family deacetylase [Pirellulales bacterium]|nr:PIG-L family deacetylase [Pirellulales bacterium]